MKKIKHGKRFEEDIKKSIPNHWFNYRLRDSSGSWSNTDTSRFTPSNICDFFIFTGKILFGVELKSFQGKSLSYNSIRENQLEGLTKMSFEDPNNAQGVFILNFRDLSETYFVFAHRIKQRKDSGERKSLSLEEVRAFGLKIPQTLKRVRYKYDLSVMGEI